jgi:very-short-patch-repair endonuclease
MTVVSTFAAAELDLRDSNSRGLQMLKAFLEFAQHEGTQLVSTERADHIPLNPFEADIRDALEARGVPTRAQFGALRFRIDIVAMHRDRPGQPVLAIECDGATYHSAPSARERDRLRQQQLERLGWRFHRIWSTDWFLRRNQELERVLIAYESALATLETRQRAPEPPAREAAAATRQARQLRERGPKPRLDSRYSIEQFSNDDLDALARWVASDGALRTHDDLVQEVFKHLPHSRMGHRIRARLEACAHRINAPDSP